MPTPGSSIACSHHPATASAGRASGSTWPDIATFPKGGSSERLQPHLYRDWVIGAMNEDMAFDRFVRLQLAADRVPDARPTDMAALAFLGLSPDYWKELQLSKDIIRGIIADEWEERIGTTSAGFLGLTVACARCHDHKFEPITTRDYYALAGVLASTRMTDCELLPEPAATRVRKARAEVASLDAKIVELQKIKPVKPAKVAKPSKTLTPASSPATGPSTQPSVAEQMQSLRDQIATLQTKNPELSQPAAFGVDDAALHVNPATGHGTRLDYTPGQAIDVCVQQPRRSPRAETVRGRPRGGSWKSCSLPGKRPARSPPAAGGSTWPRQSSPKPPRSPPASSSIASGSSTSAAASSKPPATSASRVIVPRIRNC